MHELIFWISYKYYLTKGMPKLGTPDEACDVVAIVLTEMRHTDTVADAQQPLLQNAAAC